MKNYLTIITFGLFVFITFSCKKDNFNNEIEQPKLSNPTVTINSSTSVTFRSKVLNDGGTSLLEKGFVYDKNFPSVDYNEGKINTQTIIDSFKCTITGLIPETKYYVKSYAINKKYLGYSGDVSFVTVVRNIKKGGGVTDIDGNHYPSIIIGEKEWMAKNLATSHYKDGTSILKESSSILWTENKEGKYTIYPAKNLEGMSQSEDSVKKHYGALYNWYAVNDPRGLCPDGWHVPTDGEWCQMQDSLLNLGFDITNRGKALKSSRQVNSPLEDQYKTSSHPRWDQDIFYGNDYSGFGALPGGQREGNGFYLIGALGCWWTSSNYDSNFAFMRQLVSEDNALHRFYDFKEDGCSVRCIKN